MARYICLGKQSSWDTPATSFKYLHALSVNLRTEKDVLQVRPIAHRFIEEFYGGKIVVTGDMEFPANPQALGEPLLMVFGQVSTQSQGTSSYKHTFTPLEDPDSSPPVFTVEVAEGSLFRQILNTIGSRIRFEFPPAEIVSATLEVLASKEQTASTRSPTYPTVRPFTSNDASITIGTSQYKLRSLTIEINNNPSEDHHVIGSRYLSRHELGEFEVTGSFEIELADTSFLDEFLGDSETSLEITLTGPEIESGVNYQLKLTMPKVILSSWEAELTHAEPVVQAVDFIARRDGSNPPVKAELINTVASY